MPVISRAMHIGSESPDDREAVFPSSIFSYSDYMRVKPVPKLYVREKERLLRPDHRREAELRT